MIFDSPHGQTIHASEAGSRSESERGIYSGYAHRMDERGLTDEYLAKKLKAEINTPVSSNMRKTLRDAGGPVLEKTGMAGIPALLEFDVSGSLKAGLPLVGAGTPQDTIYDVYGGLTRKGLNAMSAVERDDYLWTLEFASSA